MPSPGFAAGSFFLGGQLQAQQQAEQAAQQQAIQNSIAIAKMQMEQRRAALMGKSLQQMPDGSYKVIDLQSLAPGAVIGNPRDSAAELGAMIQNKSLPQSMIGLAQSAIASGDKAQQRDIYSAAMKLLGSPSYEKTNLTPTEMQQALRDFAPYAPVQLRGPISAAVRPGADPATIEAVYKKMIPPAFGSSLYGIKVSPYSWTDPNTGVTNTTPMVFPARGGAASPLTMGGGGGGYGAAPPDNPYPSNVPPGSGAETAINNDMSARAAEGDFSSGSPVGVGDPTKSPPPPRPPGGSPFPGHGAPLVSEKLPANDLKLVGQLQGLIPQLKKLQQDMDAMGPKKWDRFFGKRWYDYEKQARLQIAPKDDEMARLLPKIIAVEAQARSALAAANGTRAISFMTMSEGHIPSPKGDFRYNKFAIENLLDADGPYLSTLRHYGIKPASPSTGEATSPKIPAGWKDAGGGWYIDPKGKIYRAN